MLLDRAAAACGGISVVLDNVFTAGNIVFAPCSAAQQVSEWAGAFVVVRFPVLICCSGLARLGRALGLAASLCAPRPQLAPQLGYIENNPLLRSPASIRWVTPWHCWAFV